MEPLPLITQMSSYFLNHLNLVTNSDHESQAFSDKLINLQQALNDANTLQHTNPAINGWIKDVESAMFQIDDAIDELSSQELASQLTLPSIDDLSAQLDALIAKKDEFSFAPNPQSDQQQETISIVVNEARLIGRDAVFDKLVTRLVSGDSTGEDAGARVIPIVGAAGVGKAALAQLIFNHPQVKDHFGSLRVWLSFPNPMDPSDLIKSLLIELGDSSVDVAFSRPQFIDHFDTIVREKPFLVVLDALSIDSMHTYKSTIDSLSSSPAGRFLVLTQSEDIARSMAGEDEEWERLSLLSDSDCGKIFNHIALSTKTEEAGNKEFEEIGLKIAEKCDGLQLAAEAIGIMLTTKPTTAEWEDVLNSPNWDQYKCDEVNGAFPSLNVCFADLPLELRGCFLSCATFSLEGKKIDVDELIKIWMAWGYLDSTQSFDEERLKGLEYIRRLVARSFLQEFNEVSMSVRVHDLMYDFAMHLSNNKNGFIYDGWPEKKFNTLSERVPLSSMERMRFFIARNALQEELPPPDILIGQLKRVRHLVLTQCGLDELPPEIGKLIHLRHLDVGNNNIYDLPEAAYSLFYLQTLNIYRTYISKLPDGIERLQNLRHLVLPNSNFSKIPQGFEKLTNLWTLRDLLITPETRSFLGSLNQLRGSLQIKFEAIYSDFDAEEVKKINLSDKREVEALQLTFGYNVSVDVLEAAIPPPQIQALALSTHLSGMEIPSWIASAAVLSNLKELTIRYFTLATDLPPLGKLPLLEKLTISDMKFRTLTTGFLGIGEGNESGGFPRLKEMTILNCTLWNEWEDLEEDEGSVVMPCLENLKVLGCWELKSLPTNLLSKGKALRTVTCSRDLGERSSNISQRLPNVEMIYTSA